QSFNSKSEDSVRPTRSRQMIAAGRVEDLPRGRVAIVETPSGDELALYNINGELYATENFCPHRGAPLSEGYLCGHVIECGLHGWLVEVGTVRCVAAVGEGEGLLRCQHGGCEAR